MNAAASQQAERNARLDALVAGGVAGQLVGDGSVQVTGVQHDSRAVTSGDLFVAIPGARTRGTAFVSDALARNAVAVIAEHELDVQVPQIVVRDARVALAHAAEIVYGRPTADLSTVGITGTNGKTTTAWLVEAAVAHAGGRPGLLGTIAARGPGVSDDAPDRAPDGPPAPASPFSLTTPEADDIARFAATVRDAGGTHLVMEVSSHALTLRRVDAVRFRVAAFTNLGWDHLDFHGDPQRYAETKAELFTRLQPDASVINIDDRFGAELARRARAPVWRCSSSPTSDAEVRVLSYTSGRDGIHARIATPAGEVTVWSPLLGAHNLENLLVALGCGLAAGLDVQRLADGLSKAPSAPGRLERIPHPADIAVLVDYAHTPEALQRVLATLRPLTPGRLIVVFGCGGDRDRDKRPRMGEAAGLGADICVVTSDNPRTEDPHAILDGIEPGMASAAQPRLQRLADADCGYLRVEDRHEAIRLALSAARTGDTVLISGRGHERHQIVGEERRPFDDREQAQRAIADVAGGES